MIDSGVLRGKNMKLNLIQTAITFTVISAGFVPTAYSERVSHPSQLAQQVAQLRAQGPRGLEIFLNTHRDSLNNPSPEMREALDALCQQRDCYASKLYWYTDLAQAKAAAIATGKPILSLRLLGRLDQDLSCANSRFFRVALYPNAEIAQFLRDRYILHWESVRDVPKVTVDFGDGRKLERTLTGNSIHYILDSSGRPIDAIPGLYGPSAFLRQLIEGEQAVKNYTQLQGAAKESFLRDVQCDPSNHQALNNLGHVLLSEGRVAEAKRCFEDALRIDPNYALAQQGLGAVRRQIHRLRRAGHAELLRLDGGITAWRSENLPVVKS